MIAEHPDREEIDAFGQGKLDPDAAALLEQHLSTCAICCGLLEAQPPDSFINRLRESEALTPNPLTEADHGTATDMGAVTKIEAVPPELVGHPRYQVLGLLGQGGMGAVYKALHRRMDRLVALKVIHPDLLRQKAAVQRFQQEVRAAARLHHRNIVTSHDADEAADLHFLVMEYLEGKSLDAVVQEVGPLLIARACDFIAQAALGLQHAHEQGMVHRDIKPQNLMVVPNADGTKTVKVLDFGLARFAQNADDAPHLAAARGLPLTAAGAVMGTADYIAPEQAADSRQADIRSDIYSLGCTLFFALTGRAPFAASTVKEKLALHAQEGLPSLAEVRPDASPALAEIVARLTAKNPAQRYQTPADVAEALAPFARSAGGPPARSDAVAENLDRSSVIQQPPSRAGEPPAPRKSRLRRFARAASLTIAVCALAYFFISPVRDFAHTLIRIATNRGELVIEADDEDIEIVIKQVGKEPRVEVIQKKSKRSFVLSAVDGKIVAEEIVEGKKTGLRLKTTEFHLSRGDRRTLTAQVLLGPRPEAGFEPLFNGKDLKGWVVIGPPEAAAGAVPWSVADNALTSGDKGEQSLIHTARAFENYVLQMEFRFPKLVEPESRAAAVLVHLNDPKKEASGLEMVIASRGRFMLQPVGGARGGEVTSDIDPLPHGQWHSLKVACEQGVMEVFINGKSLCTLRRSEPKKGFIALQHRAPGLQFRNILIKELPAGPAGSDAFRPLFNAKNLDGWESRADSYAVKKDGSLQANPVPNEYDMLRTRDSYENYELRFQCRVAGAGSAGSKTYAGIALHVTNVDKGHTDLKHALWIKLEGGRSQDMKVSGVGVVGKVTGATAHKGGPADGLWNDFRVLCEGERVTVFMNGEERWSCSRCVPSKGHIGLWAQEGDAFFRNIEIKDLPRKQEPAFSALFNGVDLREWKGDKTGWFVKDGDLTCRLSGALAKSAPGALVLPRMTRDFELHFKARLKDGLGGLMLGFGVSGDKTPKGYWLTLREKQWGMIVSDFRPLPGVAFLTNPDRHVRGVGFNEFALRRVGTKLSLWINDEPIWKEIDCPDLPAEGGFALLPLLDAGTGVEPAGRDVEITLRDMRICDVTRPAAGFQTVFNGKDLTGWEGDPKVWTWTDGRLVGDTSATNRETREPALLVGTKAYRDFELKFRSRLSNPGDIFCGVHIRGRAAAKNYRVVGPLVAIGKQIGGFYSANPERASFKPAGEEKELRDAARLGANDFHIRCKGKRVTIRVNGVTTIDDEFPAIPAEGIIAFQIERFLSALPEHAQTLTIEDLQIWELSPAKETFRPLVNRKGANAWIDAPGGWTWVGDELVATGPSPYLPAQPMRSTETFDNFELLLEYQLPADTGAQVILRATETAKSGVMVHLRHHGTSDITSLGETTLLSSGSNRPKTRSGDGWNELRVLCQGERITAHINGETHAMARVDGAKAGYLALAAQNKVRFRGIRIKPLPAPKAEPVFSDDDLIGLAGDTADTARWNWERVTEPKGGPGKRVLRATVEERKETRLWTVDKYKDFEIEFETRLPAGGDLHVLLRGVPQTTVIRGLKKSDMVGVHVQFDQRKPELWGEVDELDKGGWRRLRVAAKDDAERAARPEDFNHVRIRVIGQRVTVEVNSITTLNAVIDQLPKEGVVGLRCSTATDFTFRNLKLTRLPPAPAKEEDERREVAPPKGQARLSIRNLLKPDSATPSDKDAVKILRAEPGKKEELVVELDVPRGGGRDVDLAPGQYHVLHASGLAWRKGTIGIWVLEMGADKVYKFVIDPPFEPLFNFKDLTGWMAYAKHWKVEDRSIQSTQPLDELLSALQSEKSFGNFILRVDYLIEPDTDPGQPSSLQIQVRAGESGKPRHTPLVQLFADGAGAMGHADGRRAWIGKPVKFGDEQMKPGSAGTVALHCIDGTFEVYCNGRPMGTLKTEALEPGIIVIAGSGRLRLNAIEVRELPASALE